MPFRGPSDFHGKAAIDQAPQVNLKRKPESVLDIPSPSGRLYPSGPIGMNKTLYFKDEDGSVWEKARELAGEKLSPIIMEFLKRYVRTKEGAAKGLQRIVLRYIDGVGIPYASAFVGRWLIPPEAPWKNARPNQKYGFDFYAVAVTAKNRIAVFAFDDAPQDGEY